MKQRVTRVTQSSMNAEIWFLDLACGHEVRKVQKTRPPLECTWHDKVTGELMVGVRLIECQECGRVPAPETRS